MVLVVGPDGAGKSTIIEAVETQLGRPVHRAHSRPGLVAGRAGTGAVVTDPHAQPPRGRVASLFKLLVVLADTLIGSRVRWRPIANREVLLVERGFYDLAVDPFRYRLPRSFGPLVARLGRLVPRADLTVLLCGDPAALHARKPEIGAAEVARQIAAWRALVSRTAHRVLEFDTVSQTPAECARLIVAALPARRWRRVVGSPRRLAMRATGDSPALAIYQPQRPLARAATTLNRPLLRAGFAPRTRPPPVPDLEDLLGRGARPPTHLAALRSSQPGRWVIGAADATGLHTVIKVGRADDGGLAREIDVLGQLQPTATIRLPQLCWQEARGGWMAAGLLALPATDGQLDLARLVELTTALTQGALGTPVVHGDLAPWNVARCGAQTVLWDLEDAELGTPRPLHDLTHFLVRRGRLLRTASAEQTAELLTGANGPGVAHLRALGLPPESASPQVRAYLARTQPSDPAEAAYRHALAAALPDAMMRPRRAIGSRHRHR